MSVVVTADGEFPIGAGSFESLIRARTDLMSRGAPAPLSDGYWHIRLDRNEWSSLVADPRYWKFGDGTIAAGRNILGFILEKGDGWDD